MMNYQGFPYGWPLPSPGYGWPGPIGPVGPVGVAIVGQIPPSAKPPPGSHYVGSGVTSFPVHVLPPYAIDDDMTHPVNVWDALQLWDGSKTLPQGWPVNILKSAGVYTPPNQEGASVNRLTRPASFVASGGVLGIDVVQNTVRDQFNSRNRNDRQVQFRPEPAGRLWYFVDFAIPLPGNVPSRETGWGWLPADHVTLAAVNLPSPTPAPSTHKPVGAHPKVLVLRKPRAPGTVPDRAPPPQAPGPILPGLHSCSAVNGCNFLLLDLSDTLSLRAGTQVTIAATAPDGRVNPPKLFATFRLDSGRTVDGWMNAADLA